MVNFIFETKAASNDLNREIAVNNLKGFAATKFLESRKICRSLERGQPFAVDYWGSSTLSGTSGCGICIVLTTGYAIEHPVTLQSPKHLLNT